MGAQKDEDVKHNKHWNLANQVDVIQSVVAQEMKCTKAELEAMIKSQMVSTDPRVQQVEHRSRSKEDERDGKQKRQRSRSHSPSPEVKEMEEKVKKLQDC